MDLIYIEPYHCRRDELVDPLPIRCTVFQNINELRRRVQARLKESEEKKTLVEQEELILARRTTASNSYSHQRIANRAAFVYLYSGQSLSVA